jgi:16S rRNA (cytosine967-C5)-methyltransferase
MTSTQKKPIDPALAERIRAREAGIKVRLAALTLIEDVLEGDTTAKQALERAFDENAVQHSDRPLLVELVQGTLRGGLRYDRVVGDRLKTGMRLHSTVRYALWLGAHQILSTRVAPHAAVDLTVQVVKDAGHTRAAPLVNAVLRRLIADKAQGVDGTVAPPDATPAETVAIEGALPLWLAEKLVEWFGEGRLDAARAFAQWSLTQPALTLRVNTLRTTRAALATRIADEGKATIPHPTIETALTLDAPVHPPTLPGFGEGHFTVQDAAAQWITTALLDGLEAGPTPLRVLDACAAPGGKTTHIVEALGTKLGGDPATAAFTVTAVDSSPARMATLKSSVKRALGKDWAGHVALHEADAAALPPDIIGHRFDAVLVDAPCSGLGVLRRHPEARYHLAPESLDSLARQQAALLEGLAPTVKPGGVLVYAVCTLNPAEGPDVVRAFLATHPDFTPETLTAPFDAPGQVWPYAAAQTGSSASLGVTLWPQLTGTDGFFAARLRRKA